MKAEEAATCSVSSDFQRGLLVLLLIPFPIINQSIQQPLFTLSHYNKCDMTGWVLSEMSIVVLATETFPPT